jgi:hypothetical protein
VVAGFAANSEAASMVVNESTAAAGMDWYTRATPAYLKIGGRVADE